MIKEENSVTIHGWMITRLGLSGTDLLIYAIIYGFSQDGNSLFFGSRTYLKEWTGTSLSSVSRSLKTLIERGLIEQVYHSVDNKDVHYKANVNPSVKLTLASVKMTQGSVQNDTSLVSERHDPSVKMTRAINDDIKADNIADNIADKREKIVVCDDTTSKTKFQKPSIEEVKAYVKEKGFNMDPEKFFDHYESNGWKVGKNPMKDWKAAVRNWEKGDNERRFPRYSQPAEVQYLQNDYSPEYLKKKEEDSLKALDDLLEDK